VVVETLLGKETPLSIFIPNVLYSDTHEPENIVKELKLFVPSIQTSLNEQNKADYYWIDLLAKQRMSERKQLGEALSDLGGLEEQLHRHLGECDELEVIIEGVGELVTDGVQVYTFVNGKLKKGHYFNQPYLWSRWEALKWSLWHECGVYIAEVNDWMQTVQHLVTSFKASYVEEHTTLKRYTVPHIPQMSKNPHVDNLMRLHGLRIGEITAKRLVARFTTFSNVINASEASLIILMGQAWTKNFMRGVGR